MKKITLLLILCFLFGQIAQAQITILNSDLEENVDYTWTNDNVYFLDGLVLVKAGSQLTIEPGTVIKGIENPSTSDSSSILVIGRDATINALGEPNCPIIFTSEHDDVNDPNDLGINDRGLWGGIAICGYGKLSDTSIGTLEGLGLSGNDLYFGGDNNEDFSGTLRYVSVRHGGAGFVSTSVINGITFAGVGNQTSVEYVEAYASGEDGIAFIGGAVDAKHIISAYSINDPFEISRGYQGRGQFWYGVKDEVTIPFTTTTGGIEIRGHYIGTQTNLTNPTLSNITFINPDGIGNINPTVRFFDKARGSILNSVFYSEANIGLRVEHLPPPDSSSYSHLVNGEVNVTNNIWFGSVNGNDPSDFLWVDNGSATESDFLLNYFNSNNNDVIDPGLSSTCFTDPSCVDPLPMSGSPALSGAVSVSDPFFENVSYRGAFGNINWTSFWSALDPNPSTGNCVSLIEGKITVQKDENNNCLPDAGELGLNDWIIQINTPNFNYFVKTNDGEYVGYIPATATDAVVQPINYLWDVCQNTVPITDLGVQGATNAAFSAEAIVDCPYMVVGLSTPIMRRCFENVYYVHYCNQGTAVATDVRIELDLDSFILVNSASSPFTVDADGKYIFEVDDLGLNECDSFSINFTLSCDAALGQTHCSTAEIFPDTICNLTGSAPLISVESECVGTNTVFTITNIGLDAMDDNSNYIVTEDHVMLMQLPDGFDFQLNVGQSKTVTLPANGSTYHLQTVWQPEAPEFGVITGGIEGCGVDGNGEFSLGFLNGFSIGPRDHNIAVDCETNVGSYDPNDKTAYPMGVLAEHYLRANTDVEYRIRFQNTGTDTAFNIVVVDTLSEYFDLNSIRMVASSHQYDWSLDSNTLKLDFANIMLPDSNTNEVASHGFVKFKISQQPDLPDGILLKNLADIYFDFNEPIRTNEEFHTIGQPFDDVLSVFDFYPTSKLIKVFPNPFSKNTTFDLEGEMVKEGVLKIYNQVGKLIYAQKFSGDQINFSKKNMVKGLYFFKIETDGKEFGAGKLMVH